mgnify:CR=1 FL=1
MILLAVIKAAGLPEPDHLDLEAIIAQEEKNWADLGTLQGTWYDDPACLSPSDTDLSQSDITRST